MDWTITGILLLDGITNGAVYALLAIAIVLVFSVTRVIFVPQGEYVALAALTVGWFQLGRVPGTVWLLLGMALLAAAMELVQALRAGVPAGALARRLAGLLALPVTVSAVVIAIAPHRPPLAVQMALTLALVTPLGPLLYRVAYRSLADASVLVLLIVSVGVHFALTGLALLFFGAEGYRTPALWDERYGAGGVTVGGQAIVIVLAAAAMIVLLFLYFDRTLPGKALRATAVNRNGARLMGISTDGAGRACFTMAAFIGALSGLLIGPTTTVFYDSGFLVGLKGFVAAVFAGLASFPAAFAGAMAVGAIESFGSFWASAFKEVIVFTAILPVLLWRSIADRHGEEH